MPTVRKVTEAMTALCQELVNKVARALYESEESLDDPVEAIPDDVLGTYQRRARAAITAMKEAGWTGPLADIEKVK